MEKKELLKAFYLSQISELLERVTDLSLLDFIYRLLQREEKEDVKNQ